MTKEMKKVLVISIVVIVAGLLYLVLYMVRENTWKALVENECTKLTASNAFIQGYDRSGFKFYDPIVKKLKKNHYLVSWKFGNDSVSTFIEFHVKRYGNYCIIKIDRKSMRRLDKYGLSFDTDLFNNYVEEIILPRRRRKK